MGTEHEKEGEMDIYKELGLTPIINVTGTSTRVGGTIMAPEAVEAMVQAAQECVPMDKLQAAASKLIADLTGAEAAYVTCGTASALTLATAACICGLDLHKMERLPDTTGIANEVIICREQRNGYDHAIRAAGARLVEVGMNEVVAGAGVRRTEVREIERAITERTVAVVYFLNPHSQPPIGEVANTCHRCRVPVIVDAAAQVPPASNLRGIIALGADLVAFSGGKGIRGPQSTGILAGRHDLIMSVALQHLDMDEHWQIWDPPSSLIDKRRVPGPPRHGLGRGFKVAKEQIAALLVALRSFSAGQYLADMPRFRRYLETIEEELEMLPYVQARLDASPEIDQFPFLEVHLDESGLGRSAFEVSAQLRRGTPAVYVHEQGLPQGFFVIDPINLNDERTAALIRRLKEVLSP